MSWLSDNFAFEAFNLKDMLSKVKDNPEQLLLGAADPVGASLWGGILGKDYEPMVNFLGGPMGGGWAGIGSGGVYDRAQEAGINTKPATQAHDIAEVVAAFYGGKGLMNLLPQGGGQLSEIPASDYAPMERSGPLTGGEGGGLWDKISEYQQLMSRQNAMSGQGMGSAGQASDPAPPRTYMPPTTYSSFMHEQQDMPQAYMPRRRHPFGLLAEDDEELRLLLSSGLI